MLKRHRGERGHRHSQVGTSRCRLETFHPRAPRLPRAGSRAVPAGWYIGKVRAGGGHDVHAATAQQQPQQHDGGRSQHGHRDACPPHARQTPRWATVGSEGTDGRCRRVNLSGRHLCCGGEGGVAGEHARSNRVRVSVRRGATEGERGVQM